MNCGEAPRWLEGPLGVELSADGGQRTAGVVSI